MKGREKTGKSDERHREVFTGVRASAAGENEQLTESEWSTNGHALFLLGKLPEAVEFYTKALERNPASARAWNHKGNALGYLWKHEDAIRCFEKALSLHPGFAE